MSEDRRDFLIDDRELDEPIYKSAPPPVHPRAASSAGKETAIHRAADAHVAKLSVAFRYAFAMGRKALRGELRAAGGPGSGNFGHAGRPGQVGGSGEGRGTGSASYTEPLVREIGRDFSATFYHGTLKKNVDHLADEKRPESSTKQKSNNPLFEAVAPAEQNEFGAAMLLSEPRQPQQAVMFAEGRGYALAVVEVKTGTRILDLSDEATRTPSFAMGSGRPEVLEFFTRPAITDSLIQWYQGKVSSGYKERHPDWKERIALSTDPSSKSFDINTWKEQLVPYAAAHGYGLVRFADEVLVVDRSVIKSVRQASAEEHKSARNTRTYKPSESSSLFTDRPTGAHKEAKVKTLGSPDQPCNEQGQWLRSASRADRLSASAIHAMRLALEGVLPQTLLKVVAAGGDAGLHMLFNQLRAADESDDNSDRMVLDGERYAGGAGSGNFGHAGRPGYVGGSGAGRSDTSSITQFDAGTGSGRGVAVPTGSSSADRPATGRPAPNVTVQDEANAYAEAHDLARIRHDQYVAVDEQRAGSIADHYDALPEDDSANPEVREAYAALSTEVDAQYAHAIANGMQLIPWTAEGQPYANSQEMAEDVRVNRRLYFFTGGDPHPLLSKIDPVTGLTANDKFRAIHDYYGHSAGGFGFGARGEENAWVVHSQMFSEQARRAMTTETRGQNSWVNFGRQNYHADGSYKNIPAAERPFAKQKAALLPERFWELRAGAFNPDQPRDEQGQWTSSGEIGGSAVSPMPSKAKPDTNVPTQDDASYAEWAANASKVAADPAKASAKDLRRAGGYLNAKLFSMIHRAQKEGRIVDKEVVQGIRNEIDWYTSLANQKDADDDFRTAAKPKPKIMFTFNVASPSVVKWARDHAADLVTQVTDTTRDRIRLAIEELAEEGDWDLATDRIMAAVGDEERAELIARHESMMAASEGQRQAWGQAEEEGLLTGREQRTWIVTPDDKLCPACEELDGKVADLHGEYPGGYDGPPAHVACRCTEGLTGSFAALGGVGSGNFGHSGRPGQVGGSGKSNGGGGAPENEKRGGLSRISPAMAQALGEDPKKTYNWSGQTGNRGIGIRVIASDEDTARVIGKTLDDLPLEFLAGAQIQGGIEARPGKINNQESINAEYRPDLGKLTLRTDAPKDLGHVLTHEIGHAFYKGREADFSGVAAALARDKSNLSSEGAQKFSYHAGSLEEIVSESLAYLLGPQAESTSAKDFQTAFPSVHAVVIRAIGPIAKIK